MMFHYYLHTKYCKPHRQKLLLGGSFTQKMDHSGLLQQNCRLLKQNSGSFSKIVELLLERGLFHTYRIPLATGLCCVYTYALLTLCYLLFSMDWHKKLELSEGSSAGHREYEIHKSIPYLWRM